MQTQRLFITASGTEVGKTFFTTLLINQLRNKGISCNAIKPVITGFDDSQNSDTAILLKALGKPLSNASIEACSPWRYADPLSPNMAASRAERPIDFSALVEFSKQPDESQVVLIEGIGGAMVPLNDKKLVADWISAVGCQACLVTGSYLGAISHTLTAYESLRARRIPIAAIVISESTEQPVPSTETANTLSKFVDKEKIIVIPRNAQANSIAQCSTLFDLTTL